jgi:hypothetical protein
MYDPRLSHSVFDSSIEPSGDLQCLPIESFRKGTTHNSEFQAELGYEDPITQYMAEAQNHSHIYANDPLAPTENIRNTTSEGTFDGTFASLTGEFSLSS